MSFTWEEKSFLSSVIFSFSSFFDFNSIFFSSVFSLFSKFGEAFCCFSFSSEIESLLSPLETKKLFWFSVLDSSSLFSLASSSAFSDFFDSTSSFLSTSWTASSCFSRRFFGLEFSSESFFSCLFSLFKFESCSVLGSCLRGESLFPCFSPSSFLSFFISCSFLVYSDFCIG